jgi:hypothetical protein
MRRYDGGQRVSAVEGVIAELCRALCRLKLHTWTYSMMWILIFTIK